uniref:Uncharacterized protein n=1 Tax=Solanum tuberosum TaxID=4113 RepID=M1CET5_SOLTU
MINQIPRLLELRRRGEEWRCEGLVVVFVVFDGFVGEYLAFAGVGCSPLAGQSSWSCCLLFSSSLEGRRKRERGSPVGAGPRAASGRRGLRLLARITDQRRRPVADWFSRQLAGRRRSLLRLSS